MLQTGQILDGKYRIIRELGSGAMGAVFEGENVRIHRRVAIKVLLPSLAENRDTVSRFEREAQAAGRIGSEHIVEVLDLGILFDGGFYMVMEFLEGITLRDRIRKHGRLAPRDVVPIVQQLLTGLEMAHEAGIVHRDLKPDNVFLMREHAGQRDFVKILDFGVSKFNPLNVDEGLSMTRTGAVVGTPFYMSPEQAKGARDIDARSDLYSVGVILYESVTGQVPFHAGTFNELIFKIVLEAPPPAETFVPDLHVAFSRIIRKAMARDRNERFQSAGEFRDALSLWLHTGRDSADDEPAIVAPPSVDFDGQATNVVLKTQALDPRQLATQVMPPEERMGTQLIEPEKPSDSKRPPRRTPPPSRRRPASIPPPPPTQPMGAGAIQAVLAPAAFPAPVHMPMGVGMALTPSNLPAHYPTPVPPMRDDDALVIAGLPRRRATGAAAIAIGVVIAIALGGALGIVLLAPGSEDETEETAPAQSDVSHADDSEADKEKEEEAKDEEPKVEEPTAKAEEPKPAPKVRTPPPPPVARAQPSPRPTPRPTPAPAPSAAPTKSGSKDGRRIKTEL